MRRVLPLFVLAVLVPSMTAGPASAHGTRQVGDVEWVVGWAEEPAFLGFKNAVELRLSRDGEPVEGAAETLEVTVSLGDQSTDAMPMRAAFGEPGAYLADLIPTAPGDYTFGFVGTVDGEEVDESFTGSEVGFDEVRAPTEVAFPNRAPANSELADRIEAVDEQVASMDSSTPLVISILALALAIAALAGVFIARGVRRSS